jgi:peptide/nickel transport system ATP-binding protein
MSVGAAELLELREVTADLPGPRRAIRAARPRVLDGINLELRRGETLGIVAEPSAGTRALARILSGLDAPAGGEVLFPAEDPTDPSPPRRHMLFADAVTALNPGRRIGRIIAEPLALRGDGVDGEHQELEVMRLMERVGLDADLRGRRPPACSPVEHRRVEIARAVAAKPALLVAEEPTGGFEPTVQADVLELLRGLQSELGFALVLFTLDLAVAHHLCERIGVLRDGRIVELEPAEAICDRPQHPYTAALLAACPRLELRAARRARRAEAQPSASPSSSSPFSSSSSST